MTKKAAFFSKKLISWYLHNQRDLPWRKEANPYFIWLSEIILQQTRVDQGLPYYLKFIKAFPDIFALANASEHTVLKLWQGLGYYSRARNLHFTAKYLAEHLRGDFPETYSELIKLKGVGDYTASAIASICFNEPTAVVDGNVYRVLSRIFGVETPVNTARGIREFKALAQTLLDPEQPGTFNQALMEFGARHCVPQKPLCGSCIFKDRCVAFQKNDVAALPVKHKKPVIKKRYFNYIVISSENDRTLLTQRTGKGIWEQLYEFPLVESSKKATLLQLKQLDGYRKIVSQLPAHTLTLYNEAPIIHKLSHQHLYTHFWIAETSEIKEGGIPMAEVARYPVPVLIQNFVSDFFGSR